MVGMKHFGGLRLIYMVAVVVDDGGNRIGWMDGWMDGAVSCLWLFYNLIIMKG